MSNLKDHLIDAKQAEILSKEYEASNYAAINRSRTPSNPDSRFYIYDLEVLQDYINLIRTEMEKIGIRKKGIRISLGKYPEKKFDSRLNPDYLGYQTIFFSAENMDVPDSKKAVATMVDSESIAGLPNLDFGGICPPCNTSTHDLV